MKELMLALMMWISAQTGYQVNVQPPAVHFLSPQQVASVCLDEGALVPYLAEACYKLHKHAIYMRNNFDVNNPERVGVLVHELTHALQLGNGRVYNMSTMNQLEAEAERIERLYETSPQVYTRVAQQFGPALARGSQPTDMSRYLAANRRTPQPASAPAYEPQREVIAAAGQGAIDNGRARRSYESVWQRIQKDIVDPAGAEPDRPAAQSRPEPTQAKPTGAFPAASNEPAAPQPAMTAELGPSLSPQGQRPAADSPVENSEPRPRAAHRPPRRSVKGGHIGDLVGRGLVYASAGPTVKTDVPPGPKPGPPSAAEPTALEGPNPADLIGVWQGYRVNDLFAEHWPDYTLQLTYEKDQRFKGLMYIYNAPYIVEIKMDGRWALEDRELSIPQASLADVHVTIDPQAGLTPRQQAAAKQNIPAVADEAEKQARANIALMTRDAERIVYLDGKNLITKDETAKIFVYQRP